MPKSRTTQLHRIYQEALALHLPEHELNGNSLSEKFGVTVFGASCLRFMLARNEYFPELERIYRQTEFPSLLGKDPEQVQHVEFLEAMPPFKRHHIAGEELTDRDKDVYVSLGIAKRITFEDFRQAMIQLYVDCSRLSEGYEADLREAIARQDSKLIQEAFKGKTVAEIRERLRRYKFTAGEIKTALKLFSAT